LTLLVLPALYMLFGRMPARESTVFQHHSLPAPAE
jgi:hypothetical protein